MENQGDPQTKGSYSGLTRESIDFKPPVNYLRFKKEIASKSALLDLASFLNEKTKLSEDAISFCRELLNLEGFGSFKTVHFFKHEKGKSLAKKFEIDANDFSAKDFQVREFNQLFQAIKKSKNRTFGQEALKGFNFDILGTFLAREFSLGNHNIILIVSRNDFLSQTKQEKEAFNQVSKIIAPYFEIILDKELEMQQYRNIKLAFENLPYRIEMAREKKSGFQKLPSSNYFKLKMEDSLDKADVFHQERIGLLGELLNTLKHELSNPLFGLQLSAELLCAELEDEESRTFMEEIASSIKRSQSIISNFTEFYTSSESLNALDLEKMAKEVFTLTKSQSRNIKKTLLIEGDKSEEFLLNANSVWLAQILFNLVVNSAQALNLADTANPEIKVKLVLRHPFEMHVMDNGPGAGKSASEKIFKPFYTTKEKGTGLGLAISQSLASKLDGKIEYIAQGQGAHFVLRLSS